MNDSAPRRIDAESFLAGLRPPTADDVPTTLDWEPLDTKDKLLAHLSDINKSRD